MRATPIAIIAGLMCVPALPSAQAQQYPSKPVTIVVPYAAGGTTDTMARMLGGRLEKRLGQTFVVENKPGAASSIGAAYVANAAPDGYTLLLATSTTMAINVSIDKKLAYDPAKDLTPVALIAGIPFLLVVNPATEVKSNQAYGAGPSSVACALAIKGRINCIGAGCLAVAP